MTDIRNKPETPQKELQLKQLREALRRGEYRVDSLRLIEVLTRAANLSQVERFH